MSKKREIAHTADGAIAGMSRKAFERELGPLQLELVKMLDWIRESGHRLVAGVFFRYRVVIAVKRDQQRRQFNTIG